VFFFSCPREYGRQAIRTWEKQEQQRVAVGPGNAYVFRRSAGAAAADNAAAIRQCTY